MEKDKLMFFVVLVIGIVFIAMATINVHVFEFSQTWSNATECTYLKYYLNNVMNGYMC